MPDQSLGAPTETGESGAFRVFMAGVGVVCENVGCLHGKQKIEHRE